MESAGQKEELSHSTTGDQLWELTITNPKEKNLQQEILHSVPNREKYTSHLPEEPRYIPATQPRKKGHYLKLSLFSNALSFKTVLPNLLLFSIK